MRVSIITPSYNQSKFIERTIQSVLAQRGDFDLEYLVVDGGSTDGTLDILRKYNGRLRWISEKDSGPTEAISKGFRAAEGEIVAWLNSDDLYCEGAIQRAVEAFTTSPQAQWLCGRCRIIDEQDREIRAWITRYKNFWLSRYRLRTLLILNYISQPATFLRRSLMEEAGGPDDEFRIAFDYAYWLRIALRHAPIILNEYLASFRAYPASLGGANPVRQFREERDAAVRYNPGFHFIRPLHTVNYWGITAAYKMMNCCR